MPLTSHVSRVTLQVPVAVLDVVKSPVHLRTVLGYTTVHPEKWQLVMDRSTTEPIQIEPQTPRSQDIPNVVTRVRSSESTKLTDDTGTLPVPLQSPGAGEQGGGGTVTSTDLISLQPLLPNAFKAWTR